MSGTLTPATQGKVCGAATPINVHRLAMWKRVVPGTPGTSQDQFDSVHDFDQRFMTFNDSLEFAKAELSGCGTVQKTVSRPVRGNLTLNIHAVTGDEKNFLFAQSYDSTNKISTLTGVEASLPVLAVALAEELDDGHLNLYKYYNVQFTEGDHSIQQIEGNNITFSTTTLNGVYTRNETIGKMRDIMYDVDPSTAAGQLIVDKWFTVVVDTGDIWG